MSLSAMPSVRRLVARPRRKACEDEKIKSLPPKPTRAFTPVCLGQLHDFVKLSVLRGTEVPRKRLTREAI